MRKEEVEDLFSPITPVTIKRMFGGLGVYRDGLMFALVAYGELFLKVDDETRAAFEEAGSSPFVYDGGKKPITMSYWRLPDDAYDDPDVLSEFAHLAFGAAHRAGSKKTRKRSSRSKAALPQ
ncbi:MAG: TfoX/Sxy family protein [Pseudomonadota bacterium]